MQLLLNKGNSRIDGGPRPAYTRQATARSHGRFSNKAAAMPSESLGVKPKRIQVLRKLSTSQLLTCGKANNQSNNWGMEFKGKDC